MDSTLVLTPVLIGGIGPVNGISRINGINGIDAIDGIDAWVLSCMQSQYW